MTRRPISNDPSGFMKIKVDERRFGYNTVSTTRVRDYTNFNPSTGNVINKGTTSISSLAVQKVRRDGKTSNPPKRLVAPSLFGYCFREPRNYRLCIGVVDYFDSSMKFYTNPGQLVREESGQATITAPHFGPNLNGTLSLSVPYDLIAQTQTELLNKIKDQKIDLGTALVESRKTISHLADTAVSLYRFISHARKGRWGKAAKALGLDGKSVRSGKSVGNRWLEYQYAWRPLMADIQGSMEEIQKGFQSEAQLFSAVRNVTRAISPLDFPELTSTTEYGERLAKESLKAKVYFRVSDAELRKLTGIGLLNPLQVAWETVPFSFMVDWLLPVGDFLEALDAVRGLTFVAGSRTYRYETSYELQYRPSYSSGPIKEGYYPLRVRGTVMDRVRYSTFPLPSFFWMKRSPLSTKRLVDAVAIGRQLFGSMVSRR